MAAPDGPDIHFLRWHMAGRLLKVAGLGAAWLLLLAAEASAESLSQAVARAIATHPEVASYDLSSRATAEGIGVAKGNRRPRLSLQAQAGYRANDLNDDRSYGGSLSATQTLYDAGESRAQLRRSKADARAAQSRYREIALEIALQTVQAYVEVQRSRQLLVILKNNIAALTLIHRRVKLRSEAGLGSNAEVYQSRSRIEAAIELLESAKQQNADAVALYLTLTGAAPGTLETQGAPVKSLPPSAGEAVILAMRHSPRLLAARYDAVSADAAWRGTRSLLAPRLNLRVGMDYDAEVQGFSSENKSASAMVSLRFDLYDGGVRKARIQQARYLAAASHQDVLATGRQVEHEMQVAWNAIIASAGRLTPLGRQAKDARAALTLSLQRFAAGLATLDTVLGLQDQAAAAEVARINEQASYRYNVHRVLAATGRLFRALDVAVPRP